MKILNKLNPFYGEKIERMDIICLTIAYIGVAVQVIMGLKFGWFWGK